MSDNANILIVDDELGPRESLKMLLKPSYNTLTAPDGNTALDLIKQNPIDLVTLDLKMPGMGGMELLKEIKKLKPDIGIIVITGYGSLKSAIECIRLDVFDYITKPFDTHDITLVIKKSLKKRELNSGVKAKSLISSNSLPPEINKFEKIEHLDFESFKSNVEIKDVNSKYTIAHFDEVAFPAYMVNRNWEIEWINKTAAELFFNLKINQIVKLTKRQIFRLLYESSSKDIILNFDEFLKILITLAKHDLPEPSKNLGLTGIDKNSYLHLEELWKKVDPIFSKTIIKIPIKIKHTSNGNIDYNILITFFREGTLLLYIPAQVNLSNFLDFFIGRNEVINQIMQSKAPSECNLAVMVADLQNSMKISADLPPYEYFKLIKEILEISENLTRKYHGTPGRHSGDGIIYFFVANAASTDSHTYNALMCAEEIRREIQKINDNWKNRKNWTNKILLNFGLHEGKEWLGCIPAAGNMDSTVLGDTVNVTSRLAEFAKDGSIWVSKKFMRVIPQDSHKNIYYGIRHKTSQGEQWVPDIYSRIMDLIDLNELTNKKLMDIANMSVTEIREIEKNDSTSNSEMVTAKETTQALNFMPE